MHVPGIATNVNLITSLLISKNKYCKRRHQYSLPLMTNISQKVTEPYKGIIYPVGDLCRRFTNLTGPSAYTLLSNLIPPTIQMAYRDILHTFHKQVTNVSLHVFVILLLGILTFPLTIISFLSKRNVKAPEFWPKSTK